MANLSATIIGHQATGLLGPVIDEKLVTLQVARCICWVAMRYLVPLSTDEDLGTGVLLCGRVAVGGWASASGPLTLCSARASLPSSVVGVALTLSSISSIPESAPSTCVLEGTQQGRNAK